MRIRCCKDCQERARACHDSCGKYLAEKAENEKARQAKRKDTMYRRDRV